MRSNPYEKKRVKKKKKNIKSLSIPPEIQEMLGKRFDSEIAQMFRITHAKARQYRVESGIPPVCRNCRLAESKGKVNRCPHHSVEGRAKRSQEAERVEKFMAWEEANPIDWKAEEARLVAMKIELRRREDEVDRLLFSGPRMKRSAGE
jgi:hypothetical protein